MDPAKPSYEELERRLNDARAELAACRADARTNAHYRRIVERATDALYFLDSEGCMVDVNEAASRETGYTREELLGLTIDAIDPNYPREAFVAFWRDAPLNQPRLFETTHRRKDGSEIPVEVNGIVFEIDGERRMLGISRDISERKRAEDALRRFRAIAEQGNYGAAIIDLDRRVVYVNEAWAAMHGATRDALLGRDVSVFHNDAQMERVDALIAGLLATGGFAAEEVWHARADGMPFPTLMNATLILGGDGRPQYLSATAIDITRLKSIEAERHEIEQRFRNAFEFAAVGMALIDAGGRFIRVNDPLCDTLGYSRDELLDLSIGDLEHPEDLPQSRERWARLVSGETHHYTVEKRYRHKDGHTIHAIISVAAVHHPDGSFAYAVSQLLDISERVRSEAELRKGRAELEAIYEHSPVMMCVVDSGRSVLYANAAFSRFTGVPADQLRDGRACGVFGCINALDDPRGCGFGSACEDCKLRLALADTLETGRSHGDIEYRTTLQRGEERVEVSLLGSTARFESGSEYRLLLCLHDVSDRVRAEQALAAERDLMRTVFEYSPHELFVKDRRSRFLIASRRILEVRGFADNGGIVGLTDFDLIPEEEARPLHEREQEIMRTGVPMIDEEHEVPGPEGPIGWYLSTKVPFRGPDGQVAGLIGFNQIITARKRAEAARSAQQRMLANAERLAHVGAWSLDVDSRRIALSEEWRRIHGVEAAELDMADLEPIAHPEDLSMIRLALAKVIEGEGPYDLEHRVIRPDNGEVRIIQAYGEQVQDGRTGRRVIYGAAWDVTEARLAEAALRDSRERLAAVIRVAPTGIGVLQDRVFTEVNDRFCEMVGRDRKELIGRNARIVYPSDAEYEYVGSEKYRQIRERGNGTVETRLQHSDGRIVEVVLSSTPLDRDDLTKGVTFIALDVTDRKHAEDALRASEQRYRTYVDHSPIAIFVADEDGRYVDANEAACRMLACSRDELLSLTVAEINVDRGDAPSTRTRFEELRARGYHRHEQSLLARDGSIVEVDLEAVALGGGRFMAFCQDITDRKRVEEALRLSNERFELANRASFNAIYDWDLRVDHLWWNDTFLEQFRYRREDVGTSIDWWRERVHPDDVEAVSADLDAALASDARFWSSAYRLRCGDGRFADVEERGYIRRDAEGAATRMIGAIQDISERKRAEAEQTRLQAQLVQAQKMEAIGQLTGGVAHDFNNLLQVINGGTEMAMEDLAPGHSARETLTEVAKAGDRAARLVSQLLMFSRRQIMRPETLDLNHVVEELLRMLRRVIGEHIRLEWRPDADRCTITADRGMIDQVLVNLCVNARDAMPDGGVLTLQTQVVEVGTPPPAELTAPVAGRYVRLDVSDTGHGMDAATLRRVFEPFFSTKTEGRGSGLGLSTVYGIVRQHEGAIEVDSTPGQGSCFRLYLPLVRAYAVGVAPPPPPASVGGDETILLAEDDESVRGLARRILERAGYRVMVAENGREAVETFERRGEEIDMALLDVVMPEMSGREAFECMRAIRPDLHVLFTSGYSESAIHHNFVLDDGLTLIQKPYAPDDLLRMVRRVLDS